MRPMAVPESTRALLRPPFRNYQFDSAYDEMFEGPGLPRPHYQALFQTLLELPPEEMRKSQQAADLSFLHQGITFTVYGNDEARSASFLTTCCLGSFPTRNGERLKADSRRESRR